MDNQENKKMSIRDVLEVTVQNLSSIAIPMYAIGALPQGYAEKLGNDIENAIHNLTICIEAMDNSTAKKQEGEEPTDE